MFKESNEITATDRILDIQIELTKIYHQINEARRPLEITLNGNPLPGVTQKANRELFKIMQRLIDATNQLNKLREDLEDGTQETICFVPEEDI